VAVRTRKKKIARAHRAFYPLCAVDQRPPSRGKIIEKQGHYDTSAPDTDAGAIRKGARVSKWLGVGAQASDKCRVLIKEYGAEGTHLEKERAALERISAGRPATRPVWIKQEAKAAKPAAEDAPGEAAGE